VRLIFGFICYESRSLFWDFANITLSYVLLHFHLAELLAKFYKRSVLCDDVFKRFIFDVEITVNITTTCFLTSSPQQHLRRNAKKDKSKTLESQMFYTSFSGWMQLSLSWWFILSVILYQKPSLPFYNDQPVLSLGFTTILYSGRRKCATAPWCQTIAA